MAVAMMVDNPEGSQEVYEQLRAHLGLDKPAGGIFHIAGPSPNGGWRVIEVWESEEEASAFSRSDSSLRCARSGSMGRPRRVSSGRSTTQCGRRR